MRNIFVRLSIGVLVVMTAFSIVSDVAISKEADSKKKQIVIDDSSRLRVDIVPVKDEYNINEPIFIKVKPNRKAYIYLFSITHDEVVSFSDSDEHPVVLVSTDKTSYKLNKKVTIACSSDNNGYITLYYTNPKDEVYFLKELKVKKNKIYKIHAKAERPKGKHALVAIFKEKKGAGRGLDDFVESVISGTKSAHQKNLRLTEEPEAYAVYRFTIT